MSYEPGTRNGREAARLIKVANDAGQRGDVLWQIALGAAARANTVVGQSALVQMRRLLEQRGIDHRAPDGFGTTTG